MTPEDVKALRTELACSAHELATVLQVDATTIFAWERGELFPTKRHCDRMQQLKQAGREAFPRQRRRAAGGKVAALRDERLLAILRKLVTYPEFFNEVFELSAQYDEPED